MSTDDPIFILGVERSGSTWLGNIFDASPAVEFLMEPAAPYARFFPALPHRCLAVAESEPQLTQQLRSGLRDALAAKWPTPRTRERLLSALGRGTRARAIDERIAARLGYERGLRASRLQLLHLHQPADIAAVGRTRPGRRLVVKELRLNLQVPLVAAAWPGAVVIVAVRDPVTQIASILAQFERGRLGELRACIDAFPAWCNAQPALTALLGPVAVDSSVAERVARYWAVQYDVLLRSLAAHRLSHMVVAHEVICETPEQTVRDAFALAGLPVDDAVLGYVQVSSTTERASDSPVDTQRVSASVAADARARVPAEVERAVLEALAPAWDRLPAELSRYAR